MIIGFARVREGFVKEWLKDVIEEVRLALPPAWDMGVVHAMTKQVAEEVFTSRTPVFAAFDAKPDDRDKCRQSDHECGPGTGRFGAASGHRSA